MIAFVPIQLQRGDDTQAPVAGVGAFGDNDWARAVGEGASAFFNSVASTTSDVTEIFTHAKANAAAQAAQASIAQSMAMQQAMQSQARAGAFRWMGIAAVAVAGAMIVASIMRK